MKRGYTLIELLIVIVIMSLITGIGFATYRDYQRRQEVVRVARQLKSDLRMAQEYAFSGIKPETNCTVLSGYAFRVEQFLSQSYYVTPHCEPEGQLSSHIKDVDMPAGITISSQPYMLSPVIFKSLAHGTNMSAGNQYRIRISKDTYNPIYDLICIFFPFLPICSEQTAPVDIIIRSTGEIL